MEYRSTESGIPSLPPRREHVVIKHGHCGGKPHIAGRRIKVLHIALWHERMGMTPAEICTAHRGLTLSDVYAALAYYYDHRAQIDADIEAEERFVAEEKAKAGSSKLQQKLAALHGKDDPLPPG